MGRVRNNSAVDEPSPEERLQGAPEEPVESPAEESAPAEGEPTRDEEPLTPGGDQYSYLDNTRQTEGVTTPANRPAEALTEASHLAPGLPPTCPSS